MRYIIPATIAVVVFVYGLIDCLRSEASDVRTLPKGVWVLLIVVLNVIGVALWFIFGRPQYASAVQRPSSGSAYSGPARSVAPDDDPAFLRNLAVGRAHQQEAERLRKLKAELDAREAKLREQFPNDENSK